jgi:hypothetical protein
LGGRMGRDGRTYRQYTVRPTAVPIRAALRAVDMMEPARPHRCLHQENDIYLCHLIQDSKSL